MASGETQNEMQENRKPRSDSLAEGGSHGFVKFLIWMYFVLLILEGPLRKWILPGLSNPLILVRDPIAIMLYIAGIGTGLFRFNGATGFLLAVGGLAVVTGMTVGTRNLYVTLYGFDACFFHLPLIYLIGKTFDHEDVARVGKVILFLAIPMAVLMVLQFRSDPTAYVNAGPGGSRGSQMEAVLGKIRPPGFFNFITGAAQFLSLCTAFVVNGFVSKGKKQLLVYAAALAIMVSTAVSTSRLAVGGIGLVLLSIGVAALYNRTVIKGVLGMLLPVGFVFFVATTLDVFKEGTHVFEARLANTGESKAGVVRSASNWTERVLGDFLAGYEAAQVAPLLGYGLGYGTNIGARVLTGRVVFSADEREWGRVIFEIGPILGIAYLGVRVAMLMELFRRATQSVRGGNLLPMFLFGACGLLLVNGQFGVASTLGFSVFGAGLCLASNNTRKETQGVIEEATPAKVRRGTTAYAEKWIRAGLEPGHGTAKFGETFA